ncbi:MAG: hypothetical protein KGL78_11715 [Burkholderiales bacterium]|nr:hypothetical protein [Burkholderiales bacterium]
MFYLTRAPSARRRRHLVDVSPGVVDVLEPDRDAHHLGRDAGTQRFSPSDELGSAARDQREALGLADRLDGQVYVELRPVQVIFGRAPDVREL